jgi:N-acetyl-gamma-glutamyl-phosphate reductase
MRIAVAGATGYAGAELVRILSDHPDVRLTVLTSRQHAGVPFSSVFPSMAGEVGLVCEAMDLDSLCEQADVVFMALPHKIPMEHAPELLRRGKKVIDLSADFRFRDASVYESHYQPHKAKDLLQKAVYGLSEIYGEQIRQADLIGNPGCYPTSVLLPLIPMIKAELLDTGTLIADSKSGVSGAGRSLTLSSLFCEVHESFKAYKVAAHRHNPEMEEILSREAGRPVTLTFVPHLVPMSRGMLTTLYATPTKKITRKEIRDCMETFYRGKPFIRILPDGRTPDTSHVRGTNYCDIGFTLDERNGRLVLISAIDNLVKGAAGQAVQNMNLMLGLNETAGLKRTPYPI